MSSNKCVICLQAAVNKRRPKQCLPPLLADFADDTLLSAIGKLNLDKDTNAFCSHCQEFTVRFTELNAKFKTLVCKLKQSCDARSRRIRAVQNVGFQTEERAENPHWEENQCYQQSEKGSSFGTCDPQPVKGSTFPNYAGNKSKDVIDDFEQDCSVDGSIRIEETAADEANSHQAIQLTSEGSRTTKRNRQRCIEMAPNCFQYGKFLFEEVNGKYKCGECGIFTMKATPYKDRTYNIRKHILYQHENPTRTYVCKDCGVAFNNRSSHTTHRNTKHKNPNGQFPCSDCGTIFSSSVAAISHRITVHRRLYRKKFFCETCSKVFNQKGFLDDHVAFVHNGRKLNECKVCSKKFSSRSGLKIHEHSHTEQSAYNCDNCGKTFTKNFLFTMHKKLHCRLQPTSSTNVYDDKWLPRNLVIRPSKLVKRLTEREFIYKDKYPFQGTEFGFKCGLCPLIIMFCPNKKSTPWINIIKHLGKWHVGNHGSRTTRSAQQRCIQVAPNRFQYGKYSIEKVDGMFKCGECGVLKKPAKHHKDNEAQYMLKHIVDRHENASRNYICEFCGVVYNTCVSLSVHKSAKHGDPNSKFPCTECNKVFSNRISAMNHRHSVHRKTPREKFICKTCGKSFNRKDFLEDHVAFVHNRLKMHECEQCSKRFATRTGLKIHRSSSHMEKKKYIYDISATPTMEESGFASDSSPGNYAGSSTNIYKDNWLPKKFLLKPWSMRMVERLSERDFMYMGKYPFHGTEAGFKCGLCSVVIMFSKDRTSTPWRNLIHHVKRLHMDDDNARSTRRSQQRCIQVAPNRFQYGQFFIEKIDGMYQCGECRILNKPAKPYQRLSRAILFHIRHYHKDPSRTYICEICGAVYNKPRSLSTHKIAKHENPDSQIPCNDCDKVFSNRLAAKSHRWHVHHRKTSRNKFTCEICGKSFPTEVELEHHVAFVHHGQRLVECEECGKKFASERALGVHRNSHTGKKKFVCDICGMNFTQMYSVTRHKNTAHGAQQHVSA